ncbi:MAG: hypothetical protein AAF628_27575 [Planctomycetota bacterium]
MAGSCIRTRRLAGGVWRTSGWALLANAALAQTFVVDDDGGPGVAFTDLPVAVASVPSGAVLRVRTGTYSAFSIAHKSITVLGDGPQSVQIDWQSGAMALGPSGVADTIVLADVSFRGADYLRHVIQDAAGAVVLSNVTRTGFGKVLWEIRNSTNVHLHRVVWDAPSRGMLFAPGPSVRAVSATVQIEDSTVVGGRLVRGVLSPAGNGEPALWAKDSRILLFDSALSGGAGEDCADVSRFVPFGAPATDGGPGLVMDGGRVYAVSSVIAGGAGGATVCTYPSPSRGGDGLQLTNQTVAEFWGAGPIAGAAGLSGQPGMASVVDPSSTLAVRPGEPGLRARLTGASFPGNTVAFELTAPPGIPAVAFFGNFAQHLPLEPLVPGSLLVAPILAAGPFAVPSGGTLRLPYVVPSRWLLDSVFYGQFLALDPATGELRSSNSFPWITKSR